MVDWGKAKGVQRGDRREIDRLSFPIGETKLRLVGGVLPRYVYWVTTNQGKKAPVECLRFMRETEEFDDKQPDPLKEVPDEIFSDKPQFAYICNVLPKDDGSLTKIQICDLKATIYRQVIDYAQNAEYGNPADTKTGYVLTIKKEKTGPLPQNVKYTVIPGRGNAPLTKEEEALELYELEKMYKRPTYEEQKQWLLQNTAYFVDESGDEFKAGAEAETAEDLG